ncbi:tryptophan synthase subunit alpha [Nesterenkonia sp. LB17]|uniref:tryptophan synthase subunit alpha n=1 Tax=unclassified Nesterenkonia TaxID=2629769 RepID=UPI001F4C5DD6|nr:MULTISPECIES: tryptophan synthase subunit alpha [unclassified Nesterenkonia]MCH8561673.1 tryptophan synthase subunit alpha [Nesterenkonia sp. YGD6]MCH8564812.1 tryptophan synthase subunit alpha [Nesterenkonia sp. LB17]
MSTEATPAQSSAPVSQATSPTAPSATASSKTADAIEAARAQGRAAFIGYLPAGYPDKETSIAAAIELARNGADVIEIGVPYSDPVMDGPVIQQATTEVLARGFRLPEVFEIVAAVVEATDAAVLVMTYYNLIDRMGADEFARRLAEAGGAGAITPDLIPDEGGDWIAATEKHGLDRVFLTAPTSSAERVAQIVSASRGFVYGVSVMGVTGARDQVSDAAERVVSAAREAGAERVCVGLGVSTRAHVEEIGRYADGVIVGTALVAALRDGGPAAVAALTAELTGAETPR